MGGNIIELTTEDEWERYLEEAKQKGLAVIVDFYATWCGPCVFIAPLLENLSKEFAERLMFLKVDVDKLQKIAQKCGISAMPTFQIFLNNVKIDEQVGASKDKLKEMVEKHAKVPA